MCLQICVFALAACVLSAPLDDNQKVPVTSTLNRPSPINPAVVSDPKPKVNINTPATVNAQQSAGIKQTRDTRDAPKPIAAVPAVVDATKKSDVKSALPNNAQVPVSNANRARITRETGQVKSTTDLKKTDSVASPSTTTNSAKSPSILAQEHKPATLSIKQTRDVSKQQPQQPAQPASSYHNSQTKTQTPAHVPEPSPVHSSTYHKRDTQAIKPAVTSSSATKTVPEPLSPNNRPSAPIVPATQQQSSVHSHTKRETPKATTAVKPSAPQAQQPQQQSNQQKKSPIPLTQASGRPQRDTQKVNPAATTLQQNQQNLKKPSSVPSSPVSKPSTTNQQKSPINGQQKPTSVTGQQTSNAAQAPQRRNRRDTSSTTVATTTSTTTKRSQSKNNDNISYNNENDNKSPQFVRPVPVEKILGDATRTVPASHPASKLE